MTAWLQSEVYPVQQRTPFRGLIRAAVRAERVMGKRAGRPGILPVIAAGLRFGHLTEAALRRIRAANWGACNAVDDD